jgi:hypothetical protein
MLYVQKKEKKTFFSGILIACKKNITFRKGGGRKESPAKVQASPTIVDAFALEEVLSSCNGKMSKIYTKP